MRRLAASLALLVLAGCASDVRPVVFRVRATPVPTPTPSPVPTPQPTPVPTPVPAPARAAATPRPARPRRTAVPKPRPDATVFRGLGTWFDLYDDASALTDDVRQMPGRGVRTLYVEWARTTCSSGDRWIDPGAMASALRQAHASGVKVVAWYYLDFADVDHDLEQALSAVRFRTSTQDAFDGLGIDIEDRTCVQDPAERSARLVQFSQRLRQTVGDYPLAGIVISPTSLRVNPSRWPDFPWSGIAGSYDVFMPMDYWTATSPDEATARARTEDNVHMTAQLTGKPVHVIGGLGEQTDVPQAHAYVDAALETGAVGGGLYDYATTGAEVWPELERLNR